MSMNPGSGKKKAVVRRLDMVLESDLESADLSESLLNAFCMRAGCNEQQCNEVGLAVRESVINAVLHGNKSDPEKKVFLRAELRHGDLCVTVRDEGPGFDPRSLPDPTKPENLLRESGRGILMIRALTDRLVIRRSSSRGMEFRMVKCLPKQMDEHKTGLRVESRKVDGVTILDMEGRIVLGEPTAALRDEFEKLIDRGDKKILMNLEGVSYIDSSGLGALVSGFMTVKNRQGQMKLLSLTSKVRELLQITKLLTVFEVFDDESTALDSFS